jgi:hypothetical protein
MDYATLARAVDEDTALRRKQMLQPVGGKNDKIFPPTYPEERRGQGPRHVFERRRLNGREAWCVLSHPWRPSGIIAFRAVALGMRKKRGQWAVVPSWDRLLITHRIGCRDSAGLSLDIFGSIRALRSTKREGSIMAKRKKQSSKVQKRKGTTARSKVRKLSKAARGKAMKRTVARAKPKRAQVKKAARAVTAAVETVAVEGLSIPAPGVTTVTEVEEAEARQASWTGGMLKPGRARWLVLTALGLFLAAHVAVAPLTDWALSAFGSNYVTDAKAITTAISLIAALMSLDDMRAELGPLVDKVLRSDRLADPIR